MERQSADRIPDRLRVGRDRMKLARILALEMEEEILAAAYSRGQFLGNEPQLIARIDVSRAVFREAIRIVEADRLAVMRTGSSGGLYAAAPDGDAVTHALSVFLRYHNTDVADLYEARLTIESQSASLAAAKTLPGSNESARIEAVLANEQVAMDNQDLETFMSCIVDFHSIIAELSKNMFYHLVVQSLLELTRHLTPWGENQPTGMSEAHLAHLKIGEAVLAGDAALASARMRRHLHGSREFNERHRPGGRHTVSNQQPGEVKPTSAMRLLPAVGPPTSSSNDLAREMKRPNRPQGHLQRPVIFSPQDDN
jgi:DNA-binding FadR family transcriptional regulator